MIDETATSQEGEVKNVDTSPLEKPGALLKSAREQQGKSLDEIASDLYITKNKLTALENDEYDKFNSDIFIQGYLRKYAPLVGLDGETLVDHYQGIVGRLKKTIDEIDEEDEELPVSLVPKFVLPAAGLGVVIVALIAFFVFTGNDEEASTLAETEVRNQVESEDLLSSTEEITNAAQNEAVLGVAEAQNEIEEALVEQVLDEEELVTQAMAESAAVVASTPESSVANIESSVVQLEDTVTSTVTSQPVNAEVQQTQSTGDGSELKFQFAEDCWIEVRDQLNGVIYTAIAKAGESLEIEGEAPFSISLGNAQAVTLYWGEELIDTQPRPGYRTAKLVVGE